MEVVDAQHIIFSFIPGTSSEMLRNLGKDKYVVFSSYLGLFQAHDLKVVQSYAVGGFSSE